MSDVDSHLDWQVVLVQPSQNKVVLFNPRSNTLRISSPVRSLPTLSTRTIRRSRQDPSRPRIASQDVEVESLDSDDDEVTPPPRDSPPNLCPLCYSPLNQPRRTTPTPRQRILPLPSTSTSQLDTASNLRRIPSYFQLLSEANSLANTPTTTNQHSGNATRQTTGPPLDQSQFNEGYFSKFFEEVQLLGKGGQGFVYLVRHLLNGEALGLYACKKIAVGDSTLSLLRILREVHLLEAVQHPNIISYHHAWLETSTPASFAPAVPTLFVLMAFANGGSLFEFVEARGGGRSTSTDDESDVSLEERKKRFRDRRNGGKSGRAVHLLKVEDILKLFGDVVLGLAFLHSRNILHLDLKAENVLLHWEDEALLPICKLSDFGNATDDSFSIERQGGSGTLAYTAPEAFKVEEKTGKLTPPNRATDSWGLGLILHLLCFFTLPYHHMNDTVRLEEEIRAYRGFFPSDADSLDHGTRHDLPDSLLRLIAKLVHVQPSERPSCDKVLLALAEIAKEIETNKVNGGLRATDTVSTRNSPPREQNQDSKTLIASSGFNRRETQIRPLISRRISPPVKFGHEITLVEASPRRPVLVRRFLHSPTSQRQLLAGFAAFVKLASHQLASHSTRPTSASFLMYLLLLETVIDVAAANVRITGLLGAVHFVMVVLSVVLQRARLML